MSASAETGRCFMRDWIVRSRHRVSIEIPLARFLLFGLATFLTGCGYFINPERSHSQRAWHPQAERVGHHFTDVCRALPWTKIPVHRNRRAGRPDRVAGKWRRWRSSSIRPGRHRRQLHCSRRVTQNENISVTAALASSPQQNYATAIAAIVPGARVSCPDATGSPLVAAYSINLPSSGKVCVEFGKTTDYGLNTWQVPSDANGGAVKVLVAGMLGKTLYHMRAQVTLDNGATYTDADHTCTTGTPPPTPTVQIFSPNGGTPQPGIEIWNTVIPSNVIQAFATDLQGNVIWSYLYQGSTVDLIQGIQLLPNGDMLMLISYLSSITVNGTLGLVNDVREVDLAGNMVREITMDTLNQKLAASSLQDADGNAYKFKSFHHGVIALPNGHWVMLAAYNKSYTNLPGYPGTTSVIGDAIVDVDANGNPDWVWNTFDHLDINRHPMNFPDWTHSNDMIYSSDDHNLLALDPPPELDHQDQFPGWHGLRQCDVEAGGGRRFQACGRYRPHRLVLCAARPELLFAEYHRRVSAGLDG